GPAEVIAFPYDLEDLIKLYLFLRNEKISYLVLGEGTNILIRDGGFKGVVIKLSLGFGNVKLDKIEGRKVFVKAQAGGRLSNTLKFSLQNSLTGLEFTSGIPGSIGGALIMNAGAYGGEIKDIISSVDVLTSQGTVIELRREDISFSYRKSNLPSDYIIIGVKFELKQGNKQEIAALIQKTLNKRKNSQPLNLPSAGSVFKNPPGHFAARLIEEIGLKGYQVGGAAVSEQHANFIVNQGSATAKDVLELMAIIQEKVWQEKGIKLEPEIRVVGEERV
ncbi:hypothetical protein DRQ11_13705, partial [candidate division KSB1 bacterium]